jgi:hypothetical protein
MLYRVKCIIKAIFIEFVLVINKSHVSEKWAT